MDKIKYNFKGDSNTEKKEIENEKPWHISPNQATCRGKLLDCNGW